MTRRENRNLDERELLMQAYDDFNARRMEAVLERMHPSVEWANGMEGGHVHGVDEVRAYWTRQWSMIDPHVEPVRIERDQAGRFIVEVHQTVRDLKGNLLLDTMVHHVYRISGGLIKRMDIE
jgi:hypothetical protein